MSATGHGVFSVVEREPGQTTVRQVTCVCGESSPWSYIDEQLLSWFGHHMYTSALDRAVEILKS